MKIINKILALLWIYSFTLNFLCGQNNSPKVDSIVLKEVTIFAEGKVKLLREHGKYVVHVSNTDFQKAVNLWEGLKMMPLLKINEGESVKVNNKSAIIEINGIQLQMGKVEAESYLKSIDAKSIKRIEITTTPNASYGSDVESVINIVLSQKSDDYYASGSINSGFKTRFYNGLNASSSYNRQKSKLYVSYRFNTMLVK